MLLIRGIIRVVIQTVFLAALLFLPIGTWEWPRAVQFLAVFGLLSLATTVAMAKMVPGSLEARVHKRAVKSQPKADRVVLAFLALFHIAWYLSIPNDVFRWQLLPEPSFWATALGGILCLVGYGTMLTALWQNAYAAPIVGDQSHRHQTLIDTGLYGWVRHPMYLGHLLFLVGLPLWLGSLAAVMAVPVVFAPLIGRIVVEERSLREILPDYPGYMGRVRHRLIPGVW